jgi:hypothetical protein
MPTNNMVPVIDLPFFELCNQAPVATGALSAMTTAEDGSETYIYYLSGSNFFRYCACSDTFQQLANPPEAPATLVSMAYTQRRGFHGRVISATSGGVVIPGLRQAALDGQKIRIEYGKGAGQERTITYVTETTHDFGVATLGNAVSIGDNTKQWRVNQWAGYMVGVSYGTGATLYRRILYNNETTLFFSDQLLMPHDSWGNTDVVAASPYAVPVATAGAQSHYLILSSTFTLDTPWDVVPDNTSYFTTLSGGIYLVSASSGAPFFTLQYYDVLSDLWTSKTVPQGMILAALGTDASTERLAKVGTPLLSETMVTSATARTLVASSLSLANDRYCNARLFICAGTGAGQHRRIVGHNATTFWLARDWVVTPDATSKFEIWPDFDRLWLNGNNAAAMYAYSPENDYWMQGHAFDDGVTTNVSATLPGGWLPFGVSTGVRIAAGVQAVSSAPTAGGANYTLGNVLTCSVGGTGAQVRVTSIAPGGVVTGVELVHSGTATGFTVGAGRVTTGGSGTGCTIEITQVGPTALITTATNHFVQAGDKVTFAGCSEAAWNAEHTLLGAPAINTFCVAVTATANMVASASQTTTVIVDASKNWIPGEHVGRIVHLMVGGRRPTSQINWITANTATTLTVATITAAVNGTSKYVIYDAKVFGVDEQRRTSGQESFGWATGGSTTTLVDSSKSWIPNQWAGYFFKIETGTGYGSGRIAVISNTETTLTFATQSFTPDATSKYEIADSWGLATAGTTTTIAETTSKNWTVNQWAGKRVRILAGAGAGQEAIISSNTANTLTTGTITAPNTTSVFAILGIPNRSTGIELIYPFTATTDRGRFMYSIRGGGTNQIDIYDLTTGRWSYGVHFHPQNELFNTGSSYAYLGGDKILLSRSVNGSVNRLLEFDIKTREVRGRATTTFLQGTVTIGNLMEVIDVGGIKIVYVMQTTGTLMARVILQTL